MENHSCFFVGKDALAHHIGVIDGSRLGRICMCKFCRFSIASVGSLLRSRWPHIRSGPRQPSQWDRWRSKGARALPAQPARAAIALLLRSRRLPRTWQPAPWLFSRRRARLQLIKSSVEFALTGLVPHEGSEIDTSACRGKHKDARMLHCALCDTNAT